MKCSRVGRLVQLLTALQSQKNYSANDLANLFATSRRTIFRDLKELQTIGVPYHYHGSSGGYAIDPEFFLPPVDLTLQEALSLLLLVHRASRQIQLPFKNSALLAAMKIENNLPAKIKQYCNIALTNVSTRTSPHAPLNALDKIFAEIQKAIMNKRKIQIQYNSLFDGKIIDVELCPYHLLYNHRAWYVMGMSSVHKTIRTFKLNRIREMRICDRCFVHDKNFDIGEYLGRAWSMIPEGRIYDVKLRFLPKVANNVTEVQWHSTQKATLNSDGSATVEFRVDGLGEIAWWILGYGDQVQVLAPKALRQKVVDMAKNMVKLNEQL